VSVPAGGNWSEQTQLAMPVGGSDIDAGVANTALKGTNLVQLGRLALECDVVAFDGELLNAGRDWHLAG